MQEQQSCYAMRDYLLTFPLPLLPQSPYTLTYNQQHYQDYGDKHCLNGLLSFPGNTRGSKPNTNQPAHTQGKLDQHQNFSNNCQNSGIYSSLKH